MLIPSGGNDRIYTPEKLAKYIIEYFNPAGSLVEPCCGSGAFLKYMGSNADWFEIDMGRDFFSCDKTYDWAITNPPFSIFRKFINHLYKLKVKNIVLLCPLNHVVGLKARNRDMILAGYGIKEIILIDTPKEFPQSGFQWSISHIKYGYTGDVSISSIMSFGT